MQLLRIVTIGNVDDGKSTFIGRLLYDSHAILSDTLAELELASPSQQQKLSTPFNLALLTDGLKAERAQGITIDVAYRFFTARLSQASQLSQVKERKFIIIDAPGHAKYTKNMVTGASQAEVALLLVDVTKELNEQTLRHLQIIQLMGLRQLVVCINKMDLVQYSQSHFENLKQKIIKLLNTEIKTSVSFFPISAVLGDNITSLSQNTPWYQGPCVLDFLVEIEASSLAKSSERAFCLPVQGLITAQDGEPLYCGSLIGGSVQVQDEVLIFPSQVAAKIKSIETYDGSLLTAPAGKAVALKLDLTLDKSLDNKSLDKSIAIKRGDYIVAKRAGLNSAMLNLHIRQGRRAEADIIWLGEEKLQPQQQFLLRKNTFECRCKITENFLPANEIGRVIIYAEQELVYQAFSEDKDMGAAILIDEKTNLTVAAVMFRGI